MKFLETFFRKHYIYVNDTKTQRYTQFDYEIFMNKLMIFQIGEA